MLTAAPRLQVYVAGGPLPLPSSPGAAILGTTFCRRIPGPPGAHVVYELVAGADGALRLQLVPRALTARDRLPEVADID